MERWVRSPELTHDAEKQESHEPEAARQAPAEKSSDGGTKRVDERLGVARLEGPVKYVGPGEAERPPACSPASIRAMSGASRACHLYRSPWARPCIANDLAHRAQREGPAWSDFFFDGMVRRTFRRARPTIPPPASPR